MESKTKSIETVYLEDSDPESPSYKPEPSPSTSHPKPAVVVIQKEKTYKDLTMENRFKAIFDEHIMKVIEEKIKEGGPIDFKTLLAPTRELFKNDTEQLLSRIKHNPWVTCIICGKFGGLYCCQGVHYCSRSCQSAHRNSQLNCSIK